MGSILGLPLLLAKKVCVRAVIFLKGGLCKSARSGLVIICWDSNNKDCILEKIDSGIDLIVGEYKKQTEVGTQSGGVTICTSRSISSLWTWVKMWWRIVSGNKVEELSKTGALIAMEIDRIVLKKTEN